MSKAAELANLIGNTNAGGGGVNRNVVINGAMNVAQRATSSTGIGGSSGYFVCDRWKIAASATNGRLTMTQDSSVPTGKGFANSTKLDCTTADTSIAPGEFLIFRQSIEGQNLQGFAKGTSEAKPFALSFYVKGNASATYVAELADADNSRQISKTFNVTTDWTKVELTYPADTTGAFDDDNATSLELNIWLHAGTTFNPTSGGTLNSSAFASISGASRAVGASSFFSSTDNTFFITGVQLEVGQNPTEFEHEPFATTLHKCMRYFQKFQAQPRYYPEVLRASNSNNANTSNKPLPVPMRASFSGATSSETIRYFSAINSTGNSQETDNIAVSSVDDGRMYRIVLTSASTVSNNELIIIANYSDSVTAELDAEL